ncbi:MAG TPA: DUF2027 domain-containing protein [Bacteroidia bacterium]|nr:DUF2027 domain-containing protein [Bacteroidia bacterium]
MEFHKGDKVRFLDEKGDGIVTRILGGGLVMVEVENGFEYPYPENQLVPAEPIQWEKTRQPVEKTVHPDDSVDDDTTLAAHNYPDGVFLVFIPQHQAFPSAGKIDLSLYNHTDYNIYFTVSFKDGAQWICAQSGSLEPRYIADIDSLTPQEIDNWGMIKTDVLFYEEERYPAHAPVSDQLRLKGVKFFKDATFSDHPLVGKKAYVSEVELLEKEITKEQVTFTAEDIRRMVAEKDKPVAAKQSTPSRKNQQTEKEVDLHIEELLENYSGMSNAELLDVQLRKMQSELDEAMLNRCQRIIFIHGVGNGRLKQEIQKILSTVKGIRYHDASYQRFGFGATEVEII